MQRKHRYLKKMRLDVLYTICLSLILTSMSSVCFAKDVKDKDITNHIETELMIDESVPFNAIDITTIDGIVTLKGSVDNILAKDRTQKIAEATVCVRSVVNLINVEPPLDQSDDEIKSAVKNALLLDPATESYEVNVSVDDGVVKLTGTVDSWQEKQLCEIVAKGVKGVVEIQNDINVDYKSDRPDYEIEQEIKERLANDVRIDDLLIDVSVEDEKVTLSGSVGSLQEKAQAISDAWVGGVNSVNADDLDVIWWARDEMRRKNLYVSRTDDEIKKAVNDAFLYDPRVYSFEVGVDVSSGAVTLSGIVDNLKAKKAAQKDAENTIGVMRVKNNIKVRPTVIQSNDLLESKISKAFLNDPYIERYEVDISAYGGIIYLSGEVNTSWEKERAENITEGVSGVVSVVNNIDYEYKWTKKPDWQIREDVKDQLFWSPFVDENQVSATINNGIVTLTGRVDTLGERQSAEDNAYQGGAKDVVNNLTVDYENQGPHFEGIYGPYGFYPGS